MVVTRDTKKLSRGKGEGAIFRRDNGLWVARIELPPRDGKRRRKEVTAKSKELLLQKLGESRRHFYLHGDIPTASQTVEQWMTYWFTSIALKKLRPNTANGYRSVIWNQVIPEIGNVRLDKLGPAHIRRVHDRILSTPKRSDDPESGTLSPSYALNAHRVMSVAFRDAEREGRVARNPADLLDAPRKSRPQLEALTSEEAIAVLRKLIPAFDHAVVGKYDPESARWATYLLTGARRGEVLGIEVDRVSDVLDLSWQLQRITNIKTAPADYEYREITNGLFWTRPKSSAGWRVIPLVDPLKNILNKHVERMDPNRYGLLFANENGLPIDPDTESGRWPKALKEIGVTDKKVRLHDVRHTTVDLLYEAGVSEDIIMEIVGHSTRTVTRGYKALGNRKRLEGAMLQLSALFEG
jgi:integrase